MRGSETAAAFEISAGDVIGERTAVLRVKGRLDALSVPILLERAGAVQELGQNLILDLSGVTFLGSSGIGALLMLVEQFGEQAGRIRLTSLSPAAASVIKLLNLDRFLPISATDQEALAAIES